MRCALPTRRSFPARLAGLLAQAAAALGIATTALAQTPQVRISQIFPYGGLLASQPRATYVELYNNGSSTVSLTGWSLQVANPTNSVWQPVALFGSIGPKRYYLVQMNADFTGTPLPTPDAGPFTLIMPQDSGKVALVLDSVPISGRPACPFPDNVVDLVGWGSTADQRSPCSAPVPTFNNAPAPSLSTAIIRKCAGKADVGTSFDVFAVGPPNPRNSFSPANASIDISITPALANIPAFPGETITITATAAASSCAGSITGASINLGPIGGLTNLALTPIGAGQFRTTVALAPLALAPGSYSLNLSAGATLISELGSGKVTLHIRPPNDDCAGAVGIPQTMLPITFTVNNDGAQPDVDPGSCTPSSQGDRGVWYAFVPPAAGVLHIDQTSAQDAAIGVFLNTCGPTNSVVCASENSAAAAVVAGQTYRILVVRRNPNQLTAPPLSITFGFTTVAPNDSPCSATPLTVGTAIDGNNADATSTSDGPNTSCVGGTITPVKSVWYSFTPAGGGGGGGGAGLFRISTCGSPIDTDLSVFTVAGCPGAPTFTPVGSGCDRSSCPGGEIGPGPGTGHPDAAFIESISLNAGTTYFIRLSSAGTPAGGSFRILLTAILTGACCDSFSGACAISTTGACPSGQTYLGAATTCAVGNCLAAPTGACCNFTTTACTVLQAAACDNGRSFLGPGSSCTLGACILNNDECTGAIRVFAALPVVGSTNTATTSIALPLTVCGTNNGTDGSDVFFLFTPSVSTIFEVSLCGSDYDTSLSIHSDCPATEQNRLFCNDDAGALCNTPGFSRASRLPTALLLQGHTYYIRVAGFNGATGTFRLAINSTGVCCRGATCATNLYTPLACAAAGNANVHSGFINAATSCNPPSSADFPCCYADFNHDAVVEVQDIFDFLNAWFASSPFAHIAGDGVTLPRVQDIFDYLQLWFNAHCF